MKDEADMDKVSVWDCSAYCPLEEDENYSEWLAVEPYNPKANGGCVEGGDGVHTIFNYHLLGSVNGYSVDEIKKMISDNRWNKDSDGLKELLSR